MQGPMQEFARARYFLRLAAVFLLYLAAGKLGLSVPFTSGNVSPVWPASGAALAAVLLWGYGIWPGIAAAAFLVNFWSPIPPLAALGLAVGNTSSALVGGYLLRRIARLEISLVKLRDVLALVTLGALASTPVAATGGTTTLFLTHVRPWSTFWTAWRVWWFGDAMGVLIVTPLFLTGWELRRYFSRTRGIELLSLLVSAIATSFVIFSRGLGVSVHDDVLAFAVFPFVIWAAIRFRVAGASLVSFLIATIAVWGTALGYGPFVEHSPVHNAVLLQLFLAVISITGLTLAAVISERLRISEAHDQLEVRVRERTAELAESNRALLTQIAERIEAQQALELQTGRLREQSRLLDLANDAIFIRSLDGTVSYWNEGAERLYGWSKQEALARPLQAFLETEFPLPFEEIREALFRDGSWEGELVHLTRNGTRVTVASHWTLWRDQEGTPRGWLQINSDISERKQAEYALRELSARLLHLQDEERRRLARELHDSTGQSLAALQINLGVVRQRASGLDRKDSAVLLESMDLAEQVVKEIRTLSYLLHPPLLDEAGLESALRWYVEGLAERSKIKIDLDLSPQLGRLSQDLETAIFRIVQECLTNIHRHSDSSTAKIQISENGSRILLTVRDQGKGIPLDVLRGANRASATVGVGIHGMRERVRELGGHMRIRSAASGTIVEVVLPLARREMLYDSHNTSRPPVPLQGRAESA
jgi:PAS domain S-box-containing protein